MPVICFPHKPGAGGPGSFQTRFEYQLTQLRWDVVHCNDKTKPINAIFVVGGTKRLVWLWRMRQKGVPVVYRLDGINWLHWRRKTSLRSNLLAEIRNYNNRFIHAFLSDYVIYQSKFVEDWWSEYGWRKPKRSAVIHNGVDLNEFKANHSDKPVSLVCLEGTLDYSPYAIDLLNQLVEKLPKGLTLKLYGHFEVPGSQKRLNSSIQYMGVLKRSEVPVALTRCIYLSLDVNPACPNTVVEAMACGSPVVAFDTGSLRELVKEDCGKVVPYGSDPWKLGMPDVEGIARAIQEVHSDYIRYSNSATVYAQKNFDIIEVATRYIEVLNKVMKGDE